MAISAPPLPKAFVWRRWHSLTGLWLVGFLIIHLLTNSQAALFVGEDGLGFIKSANAIRDLPYLPAIEIIFLAIPFFVHMVWGIQYLLTGKINSYHTDGATPSMAEYPRNHAYTWQRVTSWILLLLVTAHVIHMRFMEAPVEAKRGGERYYMIRLDDDVGLHTLAERLSVTLYDPEQLSAQMYIFPYIGVSAQGSGPQQIIAKEQQEHQQMAWRKALTSLPLEPGQVLAVTKSFGTAELLMVRNTFKLPVMLVLYTVLVLSACFHGFNGLWTFMITWGITLSPSSQKLMRKIATSLMLIITFLGLAAIWGTYWINLKQ